MRIVIFASSKFSIPLLEKLHKSEHEICAVYSQPPSISGRGMKLKENEVCLKSRELNLKLLFPFTYFVLNYITFYCHMRTRFCKTKELL